ncbi:hypothetical protein D0Q02_12340 [Micromonospora craniellae]|uniref:Membrane protein insertase YidC n=1 Tax=Micromonospora craniellae TaxID=2294034 RepID=A0A372G0I7_9ACTN|nr:hypothetical protein ID554_26265 [Micromonospora craniellae]RFS46240.1 hypothetical protein D0Q02_12340 [Micromonospora craniellae]
MLYGIPFSLLVSGLIFPIGVIIYWVTTNLFSLAQQTWVLRKYPPPVTGSAAPKAAAPPPADPTRVTPSPARSLAPRPGAKPTTARKGPPRGR